MSHATFKAELQHGKRQDGTRAVRIRITKNRTHAYYRVGIYIKGELKKKDARKGDWNPDGEYIKANWVRSSNNEHPQYNARIKKAIQELDSFATNHPAYSSLEIKLGYIREKEGKGEEVQSKGYVPFFREWIRRKRSLRQDGTADSYETILGYLLEFMPDLPDTLLTPALGADMLAHLRDTKKYSPSTINQALSTYRTIFKKAVLEGYLTARQDPFDVPPMEEDRQVERPTSEALLKLMEVEIPRRLHRTVPHARNLFLMQYFLHGARFSEALLLRWEDVKETHITYKPKKRAKEAKTVAKHAGIAWVLDQYERKGKYIFPYITEADEQLDSKTFYQKLRLKNRQVNLALRKLGKLAGLEMQLRTHMQRHTFADQVWTLTEDIRKVKEMVGHASIRTTEKYLKRLNTDVIDPISEQLYGNIGKQ